jgi:hypothetical protein
MLSTQEFINRIIHFPLAAINIPNDIIALPLKEISSTIIISIEFITATRMLLEELSLKTSATVRHMERKNLHRLTLIIDGINITATAIIPNTPTLLFIIDE